MEGIKEIPECRTVSKIKIEDKDSNGNLSSREVFVDEKGNIIDDENVEDIDIESEENKIK